MSSQNLQISLGLELSNLSVMHSLERGMQCRGIWSAMKSNCDWCVSIEGEVKEPELSPKVIGSRSSWSVRHLISLSAS